MIDDGHLIVEEEDWAEFDADPVARSFLRLIMGGEELINGKRRWCLWMVGADPTLVRQSPLLQSRIEKVRQFRNSSGREATRRLAATPSLFGEIRQPVGTYLLIPKVSSENRDYIPIALVEPRTIASGSALIVADVGSFHFGVLTSQVHNAWMRAVAGRLESRYQYSAQIVYNNFPWPACTPTHRPAGSGATSPGEGVAQAAGGRSEGAGAPVDPKVRAIEAAAQAVLDARSRYPQATLADLYDPLAMPADLVKAHQTLDRAVDKAYRSAPFATELDRVEFLFGLYEQQTAGLLAVGNKKRR